MSRAGNRGAHHPGHGVNPAATRLQAEQDAHLRRLGVAPAPPLSRATWLSSYGDIVRDFTARPLASHCSCEACRERRAS